jgi:chloride channel 3/4/5
MPPTTTMNNGASSSSSSTPSTSNNNNNTTTPRPHPYVADNDDTDELDLLGDADLHHPPTTHPDAAILADDPLQTSLSSPLTFKRKQKQPTHLLSAPARFFQALTGSRSPNPSSHDSAPRPPSPTTTSSSIPPATSLHTYPDDADPTSAAAAAAASNKDFLNNPTQDWYSTESPLRRVGYEDLTAIDCTPRSGSASGPCARAAPVYIPSCPRRTGCWTRARSGWCCC